MRVGGQSRFFFIACGVIAVIVGIGLLPVMRTHSQTGAANVALEKIEQHSDAAGNASLIDNIREIIRPDGSRSIKTVRTFRSKDSSSGWESNEIHRIFDARENVVYETFPALGVYGSLPIGKERYGPLSPKASCGDLVPRNGQVSNLSKATKFGQRLERYTIQVDDPVSPRKWILHIEAFPDLGCLTGDRTSEVRTKADNTLLSRKVTRITSLSMMADEPSLFREPKDDLTRVKPSEVLKKHYETRGRECPECALKTGQRADARHEKLWNERKSGLR